MFAKRFNQIRLELSIEPRGPLLIRSGRQGAHPERPKLEAVRTTLEGAPTVFIPGSSFKGVMRSHAETLLRTEGLSITDTFKGNTEERERAKRNDPQALSIKSPCTETYSNSCPIGRTFGNLLVRGHVSATDLVPGGREPDGSEERRRQLELANRMERRNGVGIDRLLGSAANGALFDMEAVVQGRFDGRLVLVNVQLYQLALVLAVLRELDEGFIALGSTSTRGFGQVGVEVSRLEIEAKAPNASGDLLRGVGSLFEDGGAYGFFPGDAMPMPTYVQAEEPRLFWRRWTVPGDHWRTFSQDLLAEPWQAFVSQAKEVKTWRA